MPSSRQELEQYFAQHKIQETLNVYLNDLVKALPVAPYAWLAARIREGKLSTAAAGAALTMPLVDPAVGATEIAADVTRSWGYVLGFQGSAAEGKAAAAPSSKPMAAKAAKPVDGGLQLSIESAGKSSVLVAIRAK
ncbi:hypothetical protein AB1Y20_006224 [Prymnesium parvum]|uniref:Uncharacterized protein n=1 Tax=Prymnesium parvum TaxID=97485 RepID=A0AB34J3J3_PRYPA